MLPKGSAGGSEAPGRLLDAGLTRASTRVCGLLIGPPIAGLRVFVRDLATGHAPRGPVEIEVEDGTYRDRARADTVPIERAVVARLALNRLGTYRVRVWASGYAVWDRTGVQPNRDECGRVQTRDLHAWVVPEI